MKAVAFFSLVSDGISFMVWEYLHNFRKHSNGRSRLITRVPTSMHEDNSEYCFVFSGNKDSYHNYEHSHTFKTSETPLWVQWRTAMYIILKKTSNRYSWALKRMRSRDLSELLKCLGQGKDQAILRDSLASIWINYHWKPDHSSLHCLDSEDLFIVRWMPWETEHSVRLKLVSDSILEK